MRDTGAKADAAVFEGLLLGAALGDSVGLPMENLGPSRIRRLFPGALRHHFLGSLGMVSDDTDHLLLVSQCLLAHPSDPAAFQRRLAWCLRGWLLTLPAGIGSATLRSILRLLAGFPPGASGVRSAGNAPAMRSAVIGAWAGDRDPSPWVEASTFLTHRDARALTAAMAVALCARHQSHDRRRPRIDQLLQILEDCGDDDEWRWLLRQFEGAVRGEHSVARFAWDIGLAEGVSGYAYHSVPVALYAWYHHHGDFRTTVEAIVECGGDTDTTASIAAALAGCIESADTLPRDWLKGLVDWPRSPGVMREIARRLVESRTRRRPIRPVRYFTPGLLPRNLVFLLIVLLHGFRRLLPPY